MTDQPEALRLADILENGSWIVSTNAWREETAAELRRLHEVNAEQLAKPEQDWSLLKATQESLCEHQARIKELEAQIVQYVSLISEGKTLQEPVAWMLPDYGDVLSASEADGTGIYNVPLYTAPPRKEWVGLTEDEIKNIMQRWRNGYIDIKDVEQLLKEKNGAT